jgi:hypothetical protein
MKLETAEALVKALDGLGVEATVSEGYSGRGMYGRLTVAIVLAQGASLLAAAAFAARQMAADDVDGFVRDLRQVQIAAMGLGVVVY